MVFRLLPAYECWFKNNQKINIFLHFFNVNLYSTICKFNLLLKQFTL